MSAKSSGLLVLWSLYGYMFRSSKAKMSTGFEFSVSLSDHLDFPFNIWVKIMFKAYADYLYMLTPCFSVVFSFAINS